MIRLHTLGAIDLLDSDGNELRSVLAQPKRAALLAYLAVATPRGTQRRDTVVSLFWPEQDEEKSRAALNQAIHFLRKGLGADAIVSRNAADLSVDRTIVWCDAAAFEDALDAKRLPDAVELYRGDLLDGFHINGAPEFERWLAAERVRLAARYSQAIETLAAQREGAGDHEGAVLLWRRLAARDVLSSRVALRLMRALASAGDRAGALQHARIHESLLRNELDAAPDPAMAAFVSQLQTPPAAATKAQPHPLHPHPIAEKPPASPPEPHRRAEEEPTSKPADAPPQVARAVPRRRQALLAGTLATLTAASFILFAANRERFSVNREPRIRSIAVLPLDIVSGDSADMAFAVGLHDALIRALGRYPELAVSSRTSTLRYEGTRKSLPEIAKELGVDLIVEGTLQREAGRVQIVPALVKGDGDTRLWSEKYERDLRNVLLLQTDVAAAIARAIRLEAQPRGETRRVASGPPDSVPEELHLRQLYNSAVVYEGSRSLLGLRTALAKYRQMVQEEPDFALGYAGLAIGYTLLATYHYVPMRPALDTARMMAESAVDLDPNSSEARTALAVTLGDAGNFVRAEREFLNAIELRPSDDRAHYWYAHLLIALGRAKEALVQLDIVEKLDRNAPRGVTAMRIYATYIETGKRPHTTQPAATLWSPILAVQPDEPWARKSYAILLATERKCPEARDELRTAEVHAPDNLSMRGASALVDAICGDTTRARATLRSLKQREDARAQGLWIAILHAQLTEADSAFHWLDGVQWTIASRTDLRALRWLDPLRRDPRYDRLIARVAEPRP